MRAVDVIRNGAQSCPALVLLASMLGGVAGAQQSLQWSRRDLMTEQSGVAFTEDVARSRLVAFGSGGNSAAGDETWEWDGSSWTRRTPVYSPPYRSYAAMAYDPIQRRCLLFGGDGGGELNDLWQWDGTTWTKLYPATSPPPRRSHGMAYDAARQRLVVFGGVNGTGPLGDTWEWDGTTWLQATPASAPSIRSGKLVYDAARQRVVLFSGDTRYADTWSWDGTTWTQLSTGVNPPARASHGMAYDADRQRVVMFGGSGATTVLADTWEWDGTTWTESFPRRAPSARYTHELAYFSAQRRTVLFGAFLLGQPDLWEWDGVEWVERPLHLGPPYYGPPHLVFHGARQKVLAYNTEGAGAPCLWLWEWDGTTWSVIDRNGPFCGSGQVFTYDSARDRIVMFGGQDSGGGVTSRTWEWDGGGWITLLPSPRPPAGGDHAGTYDAARGYTLVLTDRSQTWTWDGTQWTQLTPAVSPPRRANAAMAYDAARQRVVLFGGRFGSYLNDTWEWDGTTWAQISTPASPAPREHHAMAYDPVRQRIVVWGGSNNGLTRDTWEYDGSTWVQVTGPLTPPAPFLGSSSTSIAYDAVRQRMVLLVGDTWLLTPAAAAAASYGTACGGASGVPVLTSFGRPALGNASFALDVGTAPTDTPVAYLLATGVASIPIGPCTLLVDANGLVAVPRATNAYGFGSLRLPLPYQTGWLGAALSAQAAVLDSSAPLGFTLTRGLALVVGE